jgi:hypothetical protein
MSDILDPNQPDYFQVQFVQEHSNGWRLAYVQGGMSVVLTRTELQAFYGRLQEIMADELIAAGWRNTRIKDSILYFEKNEFGDLPLDVAHGVMILQEINQ